MGDIYQKASEVLIWLGRENEYEDTLVAMEYMQTLLGNVLPRLSEVAEWKGSSTKLHEELNISKESPIANRRNIQHSGASSWNDRGFAVPGRIRKVA